MLDVLTRANAIGALQTIVTALLLRKIGKGHHWSLLGGLAALEIPVRLLDDGNNSSGRETFLFLVSVVYVLLVGLVRLTLAAAGKFASAVSAAFTRERLPYAHVQVTMRPVSVDEISAYIKDIQPTIDELVDKYGDSPDELFKVLATQGSSTAEDVVVLI